MTSWKTVLHCERHPEAILRAIKRQQISFEFFRDDFADTHTRLLRRMNPGRPYRRRLSSRFQEAIA